MRIAVLTDLHANREATEAVLKAVDRLAPDRIALLGDIVGYGPDPVFAIETAERLVSDGALCLLGNHDQAAITGPSGMTPHAHDAILWTRTQLSAAHLGFLDALPLSAELPGMLFVHASARTPARWPYVTNEKAAAECLAASDAPLVLCGHTHVPTIYYARSGIEPVRFQPLPHVAAPLSAIRRHVVVVGAVGQPRDGNPAACFALLDTGRAEITMIRVPYDTQETARKIHAYGLPEWLGLRLHIGR
ncbi:MAG TPA: metallophosphoesterase family protein [Bosea sp. (in: a-proteobacteria)]|jgi:diadenosine tetraphosphatase ApaH/serine/threonine PP2A family protein phosphatase|uniref:metallophosphoesterase family protein n=1 Tax=Bosea sp. (in: a-proteobacteria) TaxID=1871050 RepID=UPI002E1301BA|nr:metallophosphoesterase family protein [Bosea sp. (in: a-proteobacteria)]